MKSLKRFFFSVLSLTLLAGLASCSSSSSGSGENGGSGEAKKPDPAKVTWVYSVKERKFACSDPALADSLKVAMRNIPMSLLQPCVNSYFSLAGEGAANLCKVDGKNLLTVGQGFYSVGFMNEERIPTVREGEPPVIYDQDMKEVFRPDSVGGSFVKEVASMYSEGRLWFTLEDGRAGCFDRDGKVVFILPRHSNLYPIGATHYFVNGYVLAYYVDCYASINRDGEVVWTSKERVAREGDELRIPSRNGRDDERRFTLAGEELPSVPDTSRVLTDEEFIAEVIDELRPFDVAGLINCQEEGRERRARIVYSAKDQFMYAVPSRAHVKKSEPRFNFRPR